MERLLIGLGLALVYSLTQDQIDFRDMIRQVACETVAPRAVEIDAKVGYPWDARLLFAELKLFGLPFSEELCGRGPA